jgi:hypothetical protein
VTRNSSLALVMLALAPALAAAQIPIILDSGDIYFQYRAEAPAATGAQGQAAASSPGLCGYGIRGNYGSTANPRVEWDINIDEILLGTSRVAGVTAGTFDVAGTQRKPRAPITALSFSVEGDPQPIAARIVGAPNADNGIEGLLETAPAYKLLTAFSEPRLITIRLKYADDRSEVLQIRGSPDSHTVSGGRSSSYFSECLRGYTPSPGSLNPAPAGSKPQPP